MAFCSFAGIATAAQFGNFTYTESATSVTITGYPYTITGSLVIPSTINGKPVKTIGTEAFRNCSMSSVTIPSSVVTIGGGAFRWCGELTSVSIPSSVTTINGIAFENCGKLASVTLSEGLMKIGYQSFYKCAFTSVTIPASVTSIEEYAFYEVNNLTTLTVAAGNPNFASVGGVLFNKAITNLILCPPKRSGSYSIPSTVTAISNRAFNRCSLLTAISIPASVTSIGDNAFWACTKIASVNLSTNLTYLGAGAFTFCESLASVKIPSSITALGGNVFSDCSKLTSVILPDSLTAIGIGAFSGCEVLPAVTIPASVGVIDTNAFSQCRKLKSISIPASVTSIGRFAFSECDSLASIGVDTSNANYCSISGVLFTKDMATLIQCPSGKSGHFIIPQGTSLVENEAFGRCARITGVTIPSTVTEILDWAFYGCGLTKITLPASLVSLGPSAFIACPSLVEAEFAGNAPTTGDLAFYGAAENFSVHYHGNKTGFTSPTWLGYPSVDMGDLTDSPAEIQVEREVGVVLTSGGTSIVPDTRLGGTSSALFTIRNTGTADLTDLTIAKSSDEAGEFQVTALPTNYAIAGQSISFQVTFSPKATGIRTATLQISSNDSDENPFEIQLTGTGMAPLAPEITVAQPVGSDLADGVTKKSFGSVKVGNKSTGKVFTITNTGTATLSGLFLTAKGALPGDYLFSQPAKTSLSAGESTTFKVNFKPTAKGTRSAALRLKSNDMDENPFDIKVTGMGVK